MARKLNRRNATGVVPTTLRHRKLIYLVVLMLAALGITGLVMMNKEEFPTFEIKQGLVAAVYPGATSEEVESQLTSALEDILFSFKEVSRERTYSHSKNGICYIYADLDCPQSKKDEVWSRIKLKIEAEKSRLPKGVLGVAVLDEFSSTSTLLIALESSDKGYGEMQEYADELSRRISKIPETACVSTLGSQSDEIAVTIDTDRLSAYGISPGSLFLDYQSASLPLPGGHYEAEGVRSPVHVLNPLGGEAAVASWPVYSDPSGHVLRLSDIASIERHAKKPTSYVSFNGSPALVLSVEMRPDNNIVFFGDKVSQVIDNYRSELPESVTLTKITDQPDIVHRSVMNFLRDLLISMLVVILVMLAFFPLKSALISSSGIPIIIAITIGLMYVLGFGLHTVTLAALITVLGMIVDDSVITMDGYMDKLGRGMGRVEAASASVHELFMPMFLATLSISLMFFPMLKIITGYLGDFIKMFPWVILIALMTSLVYAVLVVPSLMIRFIGEGDAAHSKDETCSDALPASKRPNLVTRMQNAFFAFIQRIYERLLAFCFRHAGATIALALAAVAIGIAMFLRLNVQMMPMASRDCFAIEITADANASIDQTRFIADSIEHVLLRDPRVRSVTSFVGESAPRFAATYAPKPPASNFAQLIVNTESEKATEDLLAAYEDWIHSIFPGSSKRLKQMDYQAVNSQVEVKFSGAGRDVLNPIADTLKAYMHSMSDILQWVHSDNDFQLSTVAVQLAPDEASRLGVNRSMVSVSLLSSLDGSTVATLHEDGADVPVVVYASQPCSAKYESIANTMVPSLMPGVSVPLRQVATLEPQWYPENLVRYAGEPTVTVGADLRYAKSYAEASRRIKKIIDEKILPSLPAGVTVQYGGLGATNKTVGPQILLSFIGAVLVLFLFLLVHFRKFSLAIMSIVMSALCLFGSSLGLWLFDMDFGITSVLGLISLVGIIIRNGIILFDYAEELRFQNGLSVRDAAFQAGCRRMRPIFLTSVTTALGVLPMVLSGGTLWQPMGLVICFGTICSILLIVFVMPVSYLLVFRNSKAVDDEEQ